MQYGKACSFERRSLHLVIGRAPRGLGDRIVKLEAKRRPAHGSDLFVIWGKDSADLESKVSKADLKPGDRYSAGIWPRSTEMPPSRNTSLFAMFQSNEDDELEAWLDCNGTKGQKDPATPIRTHVIFRVKNCARF